MIWHNLHSGNLGISALSISNILIIDDLMNEMGKNCKYVCYSEQDNNSSKLPLELDKHDITFRALSVKELITNPSKLIRFIREVKNFDYIFDIGGGDSFSDIYGFKRFFIQTFTKTICSFFSTRLILSPQTYGPFKKNTSKLLSKIILKKSLATFARDEISFDISKKYGNSFLTTDVAMSLPFIPQNKKNRSAGLNVSGLLWEGGYTSDNQFQLKHSYKEYIFWIVEYLLGQGYKIYLIPHVYETNKSNSIECDYRASKKLLENFKDDSIEIKTFNSPIDAKSFISSMSVFFGARMHSTIAAFSSNVPVLPYAYSRKFKGLFETLNYNYILEAKESNLIEARKITHDFLSNIDSIESQMRMLNTKNKSLSKTYHEALKDVFS